MSVATNFPQDCRGLRAEPGNLGESSEFFVFQTEFGVNKEKTVQPHGGWYDSPAKKIKIYTLKVQINTSTPPPTHTHTETMSVKSPLCSHQHLSCWELYTLSKHFPTNNAIPLWVDTPVTTETPEPSPRIRVCLPVPGLCEWQPTHPWGAYSSWWERVGQRRIGKKEWLACVRVCVKERDLKSFQTDFYHENWMYAFICLVRLICKTWLNTYCYIFKKNTPKTIQN